MNNERFDRLESKIDKICNDLGEMKIINAINTQSLQEHSARSHRLEIIVDKVEERSYTLTKRLYIIVGSAAVLQAVIMYLLAK